MQLEREYAQQAPLKRLAQERVSAVLEALAGDLDEAPKERWKNLLHTLIGRITLDPETLQCQIYYRLTTAHASDDTPNMASPRGFEPLLPP